MVRVGMGEDDSLDRVQVDTGTFETACETSNTSEEVFKLHGRVERTSLIEDCDGRCRIEASEAEELPDQFYRRPLCRIDAPLRLER